MSNISGQLIKDSYNYILQSDVNTGFVYRVGGGVPSNPIFSSGLTISGAAFTYVDGNQQVGYVLTSDASGNAAWGPISGSSTGNFVEISGSTMTGRLYNQSGITVTGDVTTDYVIAKGITATTISATTLHIENAADISAGSITADTYSGNTIIVNNFTAITVSATTYLNLPDSADTKVTGFSLNNNVITLSQNRTDQYSAFTISLSAYTGNTSSSGDYLPLSGGTVTGNTIFQSGLTANTISATTYYNLPDNVTGKYLPLSGGTVTGNTIFQSGLTANTISATTYYNLPIDPDTYVTGLTLSSNTITLSQNRTDQYSAFTISLSALTPTTLYSGDGTLSGNRIVNLSSYTLNFSSSTNPDTLVMSGGSVGIGTTSLPGKFNIDLNNTNYTNTSGADSHILMTNPNGTGQNVISSVINGSVVAKWRTDYIGNINWIAGTTGTHAFYTGGDFGVGRGQMCIFNNGNVKFETTTIGGSSVDGGYKVDVIGISRFSATTDPLKLEGVQTSTDTELLTIDGSGVVHKVSTSSITGSFLRNKTHSGATDTIQINESIFNPADLTVLSTSIFIVDTDADYYILGDLYNNGSIIVNGTLKVGGIIYNYGSITGPGIIE